MAENPCRMLHRAPNARDSRIATLTYPSMPAQTHALGFSRVYGFVEATRPAVWPEECAGIRHTYSFDIRFGAMSTDSV